MYSSIDINNKRRLGQPNSDAREADDTRAELNVKQHVAMDTIRSAHSLFSIFKVLFADGIFSFEDRRESQALFLGKDAKWAFKVIEIELSFVYDRLYTKASVSRTKAGMIIRISSLMLTLAGSVYTFLKTIHATQYSKRHRYVTYMLLAGALLTEAMVLVRYIYSVWSLVGSDWIKGKSVDLVNRSRWSGCMAQSNLITFCLKKLPTDSQLHKFMVAFSRGRLGGLVNVLGRGISPPQLLPASEAIVRAAVRQYLQRRSMLEQLKSKSFWKNYKKTRYVPVQDKLRDFIFDQVKDKEVTFNQRKEENRATGTPDCRKPLTDCRGDWVLEKEEVDDRLGWSFLGKDFDESLLLWHIATDLCYRQEVNQGNSSTVTDQQANLEANNSTDQEAAELEVNRRNDSTDQGVIPEVNPENGSIDEQVEEHKEIGMEISNYLLYIMVVHPLMLSSSTTMAIKRCRDTCAEARRYFLKEHIQTNFSSANGIISEENAHASLLKVETPLRASVVKGDKSKSVLWDGCFLAKKLNEITDRRKKWRVISRVWVEMLCYAAVQCGGYQHAERLKEGGELITFVCLLMTHLGMGKHYRTEVGDAYAHLSPFTAPRHPPAQADRPGVQQDATISTDEASKSGHGHGHL